MALTEVTIDSVRCTIASPKRTIILKPKGKDLYLPIWVSQPQADILMAELTGESRISTVTGLFRSYSKEVKPRLEYVTVNMERDIFYASLLISSGGVSREVELPIGEALALGNREGAPILVEEELFDEVGVAWPS